MTYLTSVILGFVQGVAEFLPISSSGHLSLMQNLMGMKSVAQQDILFEVLLHLGTLIAVFIVYWRDVVDMVRDFIKFFGDMFRRRATGAPVSTTVNSRMALMIILATLPLVVVIPIKSHVESLYGSTMFIGFALILTGFLLFYSDKIKQGKKTARNATMLDALIVGSAQAVAVVPGLSRSGTTISVGMMRGFDRKFAVRFSFLMSIPAILGANVLEVGEAVKVGVEPQMISMYLVGMAVAAVFGYASIKLVHMLAERGKFGKFAYYCWAVGLIAIIATLVMR